MKLNLKFEQILPLFILVFLFGANLYGQQTLSGSCDTDIEALVDDQQVIDVEQVYGPFQEIAFIDFDGVGAYQMNEGVNGTGCVDSEFGRSYDQNSVVYGPDGICLAFTQNPCNQPPGTPNPFHEIPRVHVWNTTAFYASSITFHVASASPITAYVDAWLGNSSLGGIGGGQQIVGISTLTWSFDQPVLIPAIDGNVDNILEFWFTPCTDNPVEFYWVSIEGTCAAPCAPVTWLQYPPVSSLEFDGCNGTGQDTLTVQAVDCDGLLIPGTQETFIIELTDDEAPVFTTSPVDGSGNTNQFADWYNANGYAQGTDNCGDVTFSNTILSDVTCDGDMDVEFCIVDECGNETCQVATFTVTDGTGTLACNGGIQVSVPNECYAVITPSMVLSGDYPDLFFEVDIWYMVGADTIWLGDTVTVNEIGQYGLMATVTDLCNGNSCWSMVTVEDKLPPIIECEDITVSCHEFDALPDPIVTDCSEIENIWFVDDGALGCNNDVIVRTWYAVDEYGNQSSCEQEITITRPNIWAFSVPYTVTIDCNDGNINTDPSVTGYPELDDIPLDPATTLACWFYVSYEDTVLDGCGSTYTILREWTAIDECLGMVKTGDQLIKVEDNDAPVITECVGDIVATGTNSDCTSTVQLLAPDYTDCDPNVNVTFLVDGIFQYSDVVDLEEGDHTVEVMLTDGCGNSTSCTYTITVEDNFGPVAICDEITNVSLSSGGVTPVPADVFDDGSYDPCGDDVSFLARRMDGNCDGIYDDFGPTVEFCCEDVFELVTIIVQVSDSDGNTNQCMVTVEVEDKIFPTVTCPPNQTIDCVTFNDELALPLALGDGTVLEQFGDAYIYDNCNYTYTTSWNVEVDACGAGEIIRCWVATDDSGNGPVQCLQTITITSDPNATFTVDFPEDVEVECSDVFDPDPAITGEPIVTSYGCSNGMIGIASNDQPFTLGCGLTKILRTWTVEDWCTGQVETHVQVIKQSDTTDPVIGDLTLSHQTSQDSCVADVWIELGPVTDNCSDNITVTVEVADPLGNLSSYINVTTINYTDAPLGDYAVSIVADDGCGNIAYLDTTLVVDDNAAPYFNCYNGIVLEIGQEGYIETWASDFGPFGDQCGNATASFDPIDPTVTGLYLDCDDLDTTHVVIYVTDDNGNQTSCATYVILQDNMNVCPDTTGNQTVTIAGLVTTEEDEGIQDAFMTAAATMNDTTDATGYYTFDVNNGGDYSLVGFDDMLDPHNGVTTLDMVVIQLHILGLEILDSPYKLIAADADGSGTISTLDLVEIQKFVMFLEDEMDGGNWVFIPADFVFPTPEAPWGTFPQVMNFNDIVTDYPDADFIGVKIGDVNGSVQANANSLPEQRNTVTTELITATNRDGVELSTQTLVTGGQMTLDVDAVVADIIFADGVTGFWNQQGSTVMISFSAPYGTTTIGQLVGVEECDMANGPFDNELYDEDLEIHDVSLGQSAVVTTLTASPNPFGEVVELNYTGDAGELTIYTVDGRQVHQQSVDGQAIIQIDGNQLEAGFYIATIVSGTQTVQVQLIKQ